MKPKQPLQAHESEADFQSRVVDLARYLGWEGIYHTRDSRRSTLGYPDLCLCRPPKVLFIEVKASGGNLSAEQYEWQEWLMACPGVETWVLWPQDWESGLVLKVLRRE